jgi:hypothetical protein
MNEELSKMFISIKYTPTSFEKIIKNCSSFKVIREYRLTEAPNMIIKLLMKSETE